MKAIAALLVLTLACSDGDAEGRSGTEGHRESSSESASGEGASEGESQPEPPRIELSKPAFEVVPQRAMRGIDSIAFATPHRIAVTTTRGEVAIVDIPSGHVRLSRRMFRSSAYGARASSDGKRLWISGADGEDSYELAWRLDVDEVDNLTALTDEDRIAADAELERFATVSPPYDEYDEYDEYEEEYGEDDEEQQEEDELEEPEVTDSGITLYLQRFGQRATLHPAGEALDGFNEVFFSSDGSNVLVRNGEQMVRFGLDGRVQRTFEVPATRQMVRDPSGDRFLHVDSGTVQVRSTLDGSLVHSFEAPGIRTFDWTADGRILTCAGNTLRIHAGAVHAQITEHEVEGCNVAHIDARGDHVGVFLEDPDRYQRLGEEPFELVGRERAVPARGRYFLTRDSDEIHIASIDRRRTRRLVRGGGGEYSAWSASVGEDVIELSGSDWSYRFGSPEPDGGGEAQVHISESADVGLISMSGDRQRALVGTHEPERERERIRLYRVAGNKLIRGLDDHVSCSHEYDESTDDEYWSCQANVTWQRAGFVVTARGTALSFDDEGRRTGRLADVSRVIALPTGDWLVAVRRDGAVMLTDARLDVEQEILPARDVYATIVVHETFVAAKRGNAIVVFDTSTGAPRFALEVDEETRGLRFTADGMLLLRKADEFHWYDPRTGEEMRKVELQGIVAMTPDRSKALVCIDDRLRVRVLEEDQPGRDLGPCDHPYGHFDGRFAWTHGTTRARVLRVSDGARLTVGVVHQRRMLGFAHTPQGHLWLSRPGAVWAIRARLPGPIMDAPTVRPDAEQIHTTLVADFLAGRPLGDPPSWEEP